MALVFILLCAVIIFCSLSIYQSLKNDALEKIIEAKDEQIAWYKRLVEDEALLMVELPKKGAERGVEDGIG